MTLRVLVVADVSVTVPEGGAERVLWEHVSRLARRGHVVRVLSRAPAGGARDGDWQGVSVRHFAVDRRSPLRFIRSAVVGARRAVADELRTGQWDVLHFHQPLSAWSVLSSAAAQRLPSLYTFHSAAPLEYRSRFRMQAWHRRGWTGAAATAFLWAVERACLRRVTRIHVLSRFSADELWRLYRVPFDRIVEIPGAVDTRVFRPAFDRGAVRDALGLPRDRPILLTVRNLEMRMGLDTLLRAMAVVHERWPGALLLVGGAGSLRPSLEALAASLGLQDTVRFLGFIPERDLPRYYQAADVFVLPTRELEGFGLVTVEALATGTPVLGTPVGATPELLLPLDPDLVFRDASAEAIAHGLDEFVGRLTRDPDGADRLRAACRQYARSRYDWDAVVDRLEAELSAVTNGAAGQGNGHPATCVLCGAALGGRGLAYRGRPYWRCARCGSAGAARLPSMDRVMAQYETEYPRRFDPREVAPRRAEMFASVLDRVERAHADGRPRGRWLDLGCAGGHLAAAAARDGFRPVGIDLSWQACRAARRAHGVPAVQADSATLPIAAGTVDVLSLINVLDHTLDPRVVLHEAYRVLTPGGRLVIRLPNATVHVPSARTLSRLAPARWLGWDAVPILHLYAMTAAGLRRLVEAAGFDVLEVRNSAPAADVSGGRSIGRAALRVVPLLVHGAAASLHGVSRGRWLVGPSLELYARKGDR